MNLHLHGPSALRERKALLLKRFSLADARRMCAHDIPVFDAPELDDPCPSCGAGGLLFMSRGFGLTGRKPVDSIDQADAVLCRDCGFSGDAVTYVMANFDIGSLGFALDRIDEFLANQISVGGGR